MTTHTDSPNNCLLFGIWHYVSFRIIKTIWHCIKKKILSIFWYYQTNVSSTYASIRSTGVPQLTHTLAIFIWHRTLTVWSKLDQIVFHVLIFFRYVSQYLADVREDIMRQIMYFSKLSVNSLLPVGTMHIWILGKCKSNQRNGVGTVLKFQFCNFCWLGFYFFFVCSGLCGRSVWSALCVS